MIKRKRRNFSPEFKTEAVNLVLEQGYSVSEAARNLDINANLLSRWKKAVEHPEDDFSIGNSVALQAELKRLRKENKQLKLEREILKKAATFFAKEQG